MFQVIFGHPSIIMLGGSISSKTFVKSVIKFHRADKAFIADLPVNLIKPCFYAFELKQQFPFLHRIPIP